MKILTVSPKGQITIPKKERALCKHNKYMMETKGNTIILRPVEYKLLESKDELKGLENLAESSLDFWNDQAEDIYQKFYDKK